MNTSLVEEIYSLLIPIEENRMLVPRTCVAEVAAFRNPEPIPGALPWLLGLVEWDGERIPLVSFEGMRGESIPRPAGRIRVVIFRALGKVLEPGFFAMVTQGFPQLVRVNPGVLEVDLENEWPAGSPVLCQLRMVNQRPLIPDLESIEQMIADNLAVAAG